MVAGTYWRELGLGTLSLTGFHSRQEFRSSFSAIAADRNSERLTSLQSVPSDSAGGAAMLRQGRANWNFVAGTDISHVEGYSRERLFPNGSRFGGGTQLQTGVFGQGDARFGIVRLTGGLRFQHAGEEQNFWGPSGGVSAGRGIWRVRGSGFRAFRAPTLNELFREFRVGNVVTQANAALAPETLAGFEAGFDLQAEGARLSVTAFRNDLSNLITNVTLSQTPALITRQRRNAGTATSQGVEAEFRQRWRNWEAQLSYLFADSRFEAGERIPQVAKHQCSAMLTWSRGGTLASGGLRALSLQFEDDRNTFILPGFVVWHGTLSQRVGYGITLLAQMENAFNRAYLAGISPTPLLATPRLWRAGVRWER